MSMRFQLDFEPKTQAVYRVRDDQPMRILVLGDFSGRSNRGLLEHGSGLAERPVVPVDADNFDDVMYRLAPRLHLPVGDASGAGMAVEFKRLEDMHPDSLYTDLELFRALREKRKRLLDPATYEQEAAELKRSAGEPAVSDAAPEPPASEPPGEDDGSTLERLLGKRPAERAEPGPRPAERLDFSRLIKQIVDPYVLPGADPQQAQLVSAIDAGIGDQMRALLHGKAFQDLEAAWRSLHGLVMSLETGEDLKIYLLDVSKDELAADLGAAGAEPSDSGLYSSLVDHGVRAPGGQPWSLLVGNYRFGAAVEDFAFLARLGAVASFACGPFLAAADPRILGCDSLVDVPDPKQWTNADPERDRHWQALRKSRPARWLGLALPRLLLRLPYGEKTDEIDRFEFEELSATPDPDAYLWGNPAFGCAKLIAQAFTQRGWSMEPGDLLDLEGLPAHVYDEAGESKLTPCAEVCLGERAIDAIQKRGIMPMLSYRNRDAVRLARFQSLCDPPSGLSGPWS